MILKPRIAIVDDEESQTRSFAKEFGNEFDIIQINSPDKALSAIDRSVSVAIVDECMGAVSGIDVLSRLRTKHPDIIRVLITGYGDEYLAHAINKARIFHYVQKPFDTNELRTVMHEAVREFGLRHWGQEQLRRFEQERGVLTAHPASRAVLRETLGFSTIIGQSKAITELIEKARRVATQSISILIDGETGTGKDVFARAIHYESDRPHIHAINCGLLANEQLARAELFGVAKGAFTDAVPGPGLCELADGGTLFLDEIAELPLGVQPMLLTFLDRGEFTRVGSNALTSTKVRVIAATNKNLQEEVDARRFREDLYYRLKRVQLRLPPLRERPEDIPFLVDHFVQRDDRKGSFTFAAETLAILRQHPFRGNVRELQSVIELALLECDGTVIQPSHLPKDLRAPFETSPKTTLAQERVDFECEKIRQALATTRTQEEAAAKLGMTSRWLRQQLKKCT